MCQPAPHWGWTRTPWPRSDRTTGTAIATARLQFLRQDLHEADAEVPRTLAGAVHDAQRAVGELCKRPQEFLRVTALADALSRVH